MAVPCRHRVNSFSRHSGEYSFSGNPRKIKMYRPYPRVARCLTRAGITLSSGSAYRRRGVRGPIRDPLKYVFTIPACGQPSANTLGCAHGRNDSEPVSRNRSLTRRAQRGRGGSSDLHVVTERVVYVYVVGPAVAHIRYADRRESGLGLLTLEIDNSVSDGSMAIAAMLAHVR